MDGDLDLVMNNVDSPASIYRNNTNTANNKSIEVILEYKDANTQAIGAKVVIIADSLKSLFEYYPAKGFQSCSAVPVLFGLKERLAIDSLIVIWPNGETSVQTDLPTGQTYTIRYQEANPKKVNLPLFTERNSSLKIIEDALSFKHKEIGLNFFDQERMLLSMPGRQGPGIAIGDVNQDGQKDIFVGGGKNQESVLFLSDNDRYTPRNLFSDTRRSEVTAAEFFDSDLDGDLDLYVAHGGKGYSIYTPELHDALYINDGSGNFNLSKDAFTFPYPIPTGDIGIADLDQDGLKDVVVGEYMKNNCYGLPGSCFIFMNRGENQFVLIESELCKQIGLITSVECVDINQDKEVDIILAGQYMPVTILFNEKGEFKEAEQRLSISNTEGLWNCIQKSDLDQDGDIDFILGNLGHNNFFQQGLTLFIQDFDGNGTTEQIACQQTTQGYFPIHDIDELYGQMPFLKKKYRTYEAFSKAPLELLFSEESLEGAMQLHLKETASLILWNEDGRLNPKALPNEAQYSSVNAIHATDFNHDGITDLLIGGNDFKFKPQFGRQDATLGWVCYGKKNAGNIIFADCQSLGIAGQIRAIESLDSNQIIVGINDGEINIYKH